MLLLVLLLIVCHFIISGILIDQMIDFNDLSYSRVYRNTVFWMLLLVWEIWVGICLVYTICLVFYGFWYTIWRGIRGFKWGKLWLSSMKKGSIWLFLTAKKEDSDE